MGQSRVERLKNWAQAIKRDVIALWLAARDARVSWLAKVFAAAVAAYALSPIDLIPDFIPVLGYLDDILIVPLGIMLAARLIPKSVMIDLRAKASDRDRPVSKMGLIVILSIWALTSAFASWWLWSASAKWVMMTRL